MQNKEVIGWTQKAGHKALETKKAPFGALFIYAFLSIWMVCVIIACGGAFGNVVSVAEAALCRCGAITSETIDINLIRIFIDGPEVSLNGSPTVSPVTDALCGSDFL